MQTVVFDFSSKTVGLVGTPVTHRALADIVAAQQKLRQRLCAILFKVMRALLSFPNPVNETSARLVAGTVAVVAVLAIAFEQGWLIPVLAYGFVARVLAGPTLSPLALLATRVVTPRLRVEHRYSPGPAKRFAQAMGAALTVAATALYFGAGAHVEAFALLGVLAVFASLEAAFGLCVGCKSFYLGMRLGLVPPSVCEDCARVLAREQP